jgi:Peptidase A4 family
VGKTAIVLAVLAAAFALPRPAAASAATDVSSNWAGYAVSGKSVRYRRVSGSWTVPAGSCGAGERSDSVVWVGLGGLSTSSDSLEQTGTELTCTGSGQAVYSAWYELVPAGSHRLHVIVQPGDRISASVTVTGKRVRISLRDLTRGTGTTFTRGMSAPDTTSAEWIVEAPSLCTTDGRCVVERLSNFGSVQFARVSATSMRGHTGTIADSHWSATKIELDTAGNHPPFVNESAASATPSALSASGSAFEVSYGESAVSTSATARRLDATRR